MDGTNDRPDLQIVNRYALESLIGQGATSEIYLATDRHTDQTVVLKRVYIAGMRQTELEQVMTEVIPDLHPDSFHNTGVCPPDTASASQRDPIPRELCA